MEVFGFVALIVTLLWSSLFAVRTRIEFRARLCEALAAAARRGLPLRPVLVAAQNDFRGARRRALARACAALDDGLPIHEACRRAGRRYFPREALAGIAIAEGGASFPSALQAAAVDSERSLDMRHRSLLVLAYPAVLIAVVPVVLYASNKLASVIESLGLANTRAGDWIALSQTVGQAGFWAVAVLAGSWLFLGRWLPYPGRRLLRAERALRAGATRLRAGGDWTGAPRQLPSDLAARFTVALTCVPERAARSIERIAAECALRGDERARRSMRVVQTLLLFLIGFVAMLQFGSVFLVQRACLGEVVPW